MAAELDHVGRIQAQWNQERPDLDVSPQGIIGRLHRLAADLTQELTKVYAQFGLSEGEFDVLCALRRAGTPFARQHADLAKATMITNGGLTKRVDRLARIGLVTRESSVTGDRRLRVIALTDEGRRLIDAAFTMHMSNEARLVAQLNPRDRPRLEWILKSWLTEVGDGDPR